MTDPKEVVRRGYDEIAARYNAWADSFETPERAWVDKLLARLEAGANVLELGCGAARHTSQTLAARHRYTGVDLSAAQLELARRRLPDATFVQADAVELELEPASFDAVVSLFMFGHIPRAEQEPLLRKIAAWLRPSGVLLATLGTANAQDVDDDWLGARMFFASFDEQTNLDILERSGFEIDEARVVPFDEPGHGLVRFMWVLASTPG